MEFLASPADADEAIRLLIRKCHRLRWAVAWASPGFPAFELLRQNEQKIRQLTVGTHFCQTHPEFIAAFLNNEAVRFVMDTGGVFHPKLYLFEHADGRWDCIVGSPNFTRAAFSTNLEIAVHISNRDVDAQRAYGRIVKALDDSFTKGRRLDAAALSEYRRLWESQRQHLESLAGGGPPVKTVPPPSDVPLAALSWPEYFVAVRNDPIHPIEDRLAVLETGRHLFQKYRQFSAMDGDSRLGLAGLYKRRQGIHWGLFGNMISNFKFGKPVRENNLTLSAALDEIPLAGQVRREHFEQYASLFCRVAPARITSLTRLLAMKRPDYFVCITKKNTAKVHAEFGAEEIDLANYWGTVIEPMTRFTWWMAGEPDDEFQRRIWRCRVALIDVWCKEEPHG